MPLLFFVSGFLFFKPGTQVIGNVRTQLVRRAKRLLIPYIVTGWLVLLLKGYFGYWFFYILLILNLIILIELYVEESLHLRIGHECIGHLIVFATLVFCTKQLSQYTLPSEISHLVGLPNYYLAFIFGYMTHKCKEIERLILNHVFSFICLLVYIGLMILTSYYGITCKLNIFIPVFVIAFLYGSFLNYKTFFGGGLTYIGKHSMEIYVLHLFFVMPFKDVGSYIITIKDLPQSLTLQITYAIVISSIAIVLSVVSANLLKSNKYLSKLMFGI